MVHPQEEAIILAMHTIVKMTLLTLLVAITAHPIALEADIPPPVPIVKKPLTVQQTISKFASPNDKVELLSVAKCESNFNPKAIGDSGKAKNIFQYHEKTFDRFSLLLGEELDYNSYYDQSKLTGWVWENRPDLKNHWTCYTKLISSN